MSILFTLSRHLSSPFALVLGALLVASPPARGNRDPLFSGSSLTGLPDASAPPSDGTWDVLDANGDLVWPCCGYETVLDLPDAQMPPDYFSPGAVEPVMGTSTRQHSAGVGRRAF